MSVGEINKGVVALLLALIIGAAGFMWYTKMYKPAVAERVAAEATASTAQQGLAAKKAELVAAQKTLDDAKDDASGPDESVARVAKAGSAVPDKPLVDDANLVLTKIAEKAGIDTDIAFDTKTAPAAQAGSGLAGTTPIDISLEAAGSYSEMLNFIDLIEDSVQVKDNKMYQRGRLFNVVSIEIAPPPENQGAAENFLGTGEGAANPGGGSGLVYGKNDVAFTIVVRMYMTTAAAAQTAGVGAVDPTAGAAATDPATAGAGTGVTSPAGAAGTPGGSVAGANGSATPGTAGGATTPTGTAGTPGAISADGASATTTPTPAGSPS